MKQRPLSFSPNLPNWGALQIAGIYLLIGSLWILFSDRMAETIALNKEMLARISLYKGWGFVIVTAFLLYWLIQRHTGQLHASERQLKVVINALPVLISYIDKDRHYQFANDAYEEWFGEKAHGKHIEEVVGQAIYQKTSKYVDKVLNGETVAYETEIPYQDGDDRFVSATYVPDIADNRQVKGFFTLVQDISEQKEAKEKLRQWADAFEGCAHGIAVWDPDTNRIVVCNPAFANLHRCSVDEIVGVSILSLYAPSDHEHVRISVEKADQIGHSRYEARMIRRDGFTFPVQMDLVSILGEDGELMYRVATTQDITERKQTEERIMQQARLLEQVNDAILASDENFTLTFWNAAAERIFGWNAEEMIGQKAEKILQTEFSNLTRPDAIKELQEDGEFSADVTQLRKDGTRVHIETRTVALRDGNGHSQGYVSINRDISERKHAEEELKKREERYRYLFQNNPYPMWIYDRKTLVFLDVNEAAITKYGYSHEEFLRMTIVAIRPPEDKERLINNLAQPRQPLEHSDGWRHCLKDGSIIYVEITSHTLEIDGHESVFVIAQDITERKQVEQALRESEEKFSVIYYKAPFAAALSRLPDGVIMDINEAFEKVYGYTKQEVIGKTSLELGINPDAEVRTRIVSELEAKGSVHEIELKLHTKADGERVFLMNIDLIGVGGQKYIFQTAQDITERKQAEADLQKAHSELEVKVQARTAALSEANALLQAMMDYVPDHIYFKDLQCRFIRNSRSQASLLGLNDPRAVIGKTDFDFFPHAAKAYAEEQEVMRSGEPLIDFEEWVVWPDGRESWVSTTKVPLRNSEGETIGIFGISRDITERKRAEQSIQELNRDLENQAVKLQAANKELEAFSYSVSHDLRAPLRAIDGYTRILVEDYEMLLDEEGKRICGVISAEARRMGQLIDDLLAFSRLGRKEMYSSNIDMKALVVSVLNELLQEKDRERMDIRITKLPSARADSSLIRQVWVNLLSNALKFTSKKEQAAIEVGSKSSKDQVIYYVRETGAGFDMEYANKLFGVFQRLHSESEFNGTGVGLAIVQRIIRRHGGRVWAEGEVDKGATFYFALPRKEIPHE
jgi:PAS domain S-box-containing protein